MHSDTHQHPEFQIPAPINGIAHAISSAVQHVAVVGKKAVKRIQMGQMTSVMHRMNNEQLASLGITRREIPEYVDLIMRDNIN